MTIQAPAKINRFLYVLNRLPNGYHEILTMFEKLSLFDTIEIYAEKSNNTDISIQCPSWLPAGSDNLAYKAAMAFTKASGLDMYIKIKLDKQIPAGGGLGGGSSDAAATLTALNKLAGTPLKPEQLHEIGCNIGADVPFFLTDLNCAIGTGTGTDLQPCKASPNWYILVFPDISISTRWAYQNFKLTRKSDITIFDRRRLLSGDLWQNDLEEPVCARYPELITIKKSLLRAGAEASLMSGSGSTVFGVFKDRDKALRGAASVTADTGMNCLVTRTLEKL